MGIRSVVKKGVKNNTNFKRWAAWDTIKGNGKIIGNFISDLRAPHTKDVPVKETFEEAVARYQLSETDIRKRMRSHFRVALFCVLLGLVALGWTVYWLMQWMFLSGLVALALAMLMFAYAFREHFYYFKMKKRRLDCTVHEWFSSFCPVKRKKA